MLITLRAYKRRELYPMGLTIGIENALQNKL